MPRILYLILCLLSTSTLLTAQTTTEFHKFYGDFGVSVINFQQVAPTQDDHLLLLGSHDSLTVGAILQKVDTVGNPVWRRMFYLATFRHVLPANDGGYFLMGKTKGLQRRSVVMKTDANGNTLWYEVLFHPNSNSELVHAIETPGGGIIAVGSYVTGINSDMMAIRMDSLGNLLWSKTYEDPIFDSGARQILPLPNDRYMILGDHGTNDPGLTRIDSAGNLLDARTYPSADLDVINELQPVGDGTFIGIGGDNWGNAFDDVGSVFRMDSLGNILWFQELVPRYLVTQDNDMNFLTMTPPEDGKFLIGGLCQSFGNGKEEMYVIEMDTAGNVVWKRTVGTTGMDRLVDLYQSPSGSIYGTGWHSPTGHVSLNRGSFFKFRQKDRAYWVNRYYDSENTVAVDTAKDKGLWMLTQNIPSQMYRITRIDSLGKVIFEQSYGSGNNPEHFYDMKATLDNGVIVCGNWDTLGFNRFFLMKIDSMGNQEWIGHYNAGGARAVLPAPDGGYVAVGDSTGQAWILKVDASGNRVWSAFHSQPPAYTAICNDVVQAPDGGWVVTGKMDSGNVRVMVWKVDSVGTHQWMHTYRPSMWGQEGWAIINAHNGGYIMSVEGYFPASLYYVKTDSIGQWQWQTNYTGVGQSQRLIPTLDGGYCFTGRQGGWAPFELYKMDVNGNIVWNDTLYQSGSGRRHFVQLSDSSFYFGGGGTWHSAYRTDQYGNLTYCNLHDPPMKFYDYPAPQAVADTFQVVTITDTAWTTAGSLLAFPNPNVDDTCTNCQPIPQAYYSDSVNSALVEFYNFSQYATQFYWDFGDGNTSTQASPVHTYAGNGTYQVCLTATNGCQSQTTCDTVVICILPSATGIVAVDSGATVTFSGMTAGAATVEWDFGDGNTSTQPSPVHTYAASGDYEVCLIATNACGADTICDTITVCLPAVPSFAYSNTGWLFQFSDSSVLANSWFWDFGDGSTSTAQDPLHGYSNPGNYQVCLTASNSCDTSTWCDSISVLVSTDPGQDLRMTPHPNPTTGQVYLQMEGQMAQAAEVRVFDPVGKLIWVEEVELVPGRNFAADLSGQAAGIYWLQVRTPLGQRAWQIALRK